MSPAKHSFACLPRKMTTGQTERTDGWTDRRWTKRSLCAAMLRRQKRQLHKFHALASSVFNLKIIGVVLISPK